MRDDVPMTYFYKTTKTPVGRLKLIATDRGLAAILWENDDPKRVRLNAVTENQNHPVLVETESQLADYFAGKRRNFSIPFDPVGTDFKGMSGMPFPRFLSVKRAAMRRLRSRLAGRRRCVRSARRTGRIPSRSWCPAIV